VITSFYVFPFPFVFVLSQNISIFCLFAPWESFFSPRLSAHQPFSLLVYFSPPAVVNVSLKDIVGDKIFVSGIAHFFTNASAEVSKGEKHPFHRFHDVEHG
jgi:hypothetical protein